jgi:cell wall-associated NlpC family hydrolase
MMRVLIGIVTAGALALVFLAGLASSAGATTVSQREQGAIREQAIVNAAHRQLGKPYIWGGWLPHSAILIYRHLRHERHPQPGDVVAFVRAGVAYHVGIVYKPARHLMIVAPHIGARIKIESWTWGGSSVRFAYLPYIHG